VPREEAVVVILGDAVGVKASLLDAMKICIYDHKGTLTDSTVDTQMPLPNSMSNDASASAMPVERTHSRSTCSIPATG